MIHVVHADCLKFLPAEGIPATFIYMDPPFMTQRVHRMGNSVAFDDRWDNWWTFNRSLVPRVIACWQSLNERGSLVLHLGPDVARRVAVALIPFLGEPTSEVIWRYRRWPSKTKNLQKVHDVMLRWAKPGATFHQLYEPLAESTRKTWGDSKQLAVVDASGRRTRSSKTEEKSPGVPLGDVWDDIGIVAPVAHERTGYPTQKPEALLRRWIEMSTDPGDLVIDPFMGSGTTLAAARALGRSAVGIDTSALAVEVASRRLGLEAA